ncbi:hypothetical protein CRUP_029838 [Coryphaenoides rupestris]|nr:hypothetical protein CRUP_029838 [Coryphaenoides rupestris]
MSPKILPSPPLRSAALLSDQTSSSSSSLFSSAATLWLLHLLDLFQVAWTKQGEEDEGETTVPSSDNRRREVGERAPIVGLFLPCFQRHAGTLAWRRYFWGLWRWQRGVRCGGDGLRTGGGASLYHSGSIRSGPVH